MIDLALKSLCKDNIKLPIKFFTFSNVAVFP